MHVVGQDQDWSGGLQADACWSPTMKRGSHTDEGKVVHSSTFSAEASVSGAIGGMCARIS